MEVGRWYEVNHQFYVIARLWARMTIFDEPSEAGVTETLNRIKALRSDLDDVIAELEEEMWLL